MQQGDLPENDIEEVVRELQGIHRQSGVSSLVAVGGVILQRFFGGSAKAWASPQRDRQHSLRRLARHEGCPYSKSALHQAVRVYLVHQESPCVQTFGHIGPSHVVAVLSLDRRDREAMLEAASQGRWSVRRLRAEIDRRFARPTPHRGRAPADASERAVATVRHCVCRLQTSLVETTQDEGPIKTRDDLAAELRRLVHICDQYLDELDARPTVTAVRLAKVTPRNAALVNEPYSLERS